MKRFIPILVLAFLSAVSTRAQHTASLSWTASSDATANPTLSYNVYRQAGLCPIGTTPTGFVKINTTPVTTPSFTDPNVPLGNNCYYITSTLNGVESTPSNTASAVVLPAAPTVLKVTGTT